ncbi:MULTISPECIES: hypothetical protein [Kamptonema]|uniref:hypothetical protein n=1 Tax=Kamptonema TaxID=1501433 RepID=UPI0002E959E0|nr:MULTISPECIES: hypothetical protein [Kamptonema]
MSPLNCYTGCVSGKEKEEGRRKREEGRRKKEEGIGVNLTSNSQSDRGFNPCLKA